MAASNRAPVELRAGRLTLVVEFRGDRYTHAVDGPHSSVIDSAAIESAAAAGFDTPVYQELHEQGNLLFLSGASDDRHWSLSIEATPEGLVRFDAACRAKSAVNPATVYRHFGSIGEVNAGEDTIEEMSPDALVFRPRDAPTQYPATLRWRWEVRQH